MKHLRKNVRFYISLILIILLLLSVLLTLFLVKSLPKESSQGVTDKITQEENTNGLDDGIVDKESQVKPHVPRYDIELAFTPETRLLKGKRKLPCGIEQSKLQAR